MPLVARDADERMMRVVQSAAFAAAYAETRANNEAEHLLFPALARALPDVIRPRPPATIVGLTPDNPTIRREKPGTLLTARSGARFVTSWATSYTPITVARAQIIRPQPSMQVLSITLEVASGVSFKTALGETLRFYLGAAFAIDLIHALRGTVATVTARDTGGRAVGEVTLQDAVRWVRIDTDEPALVAARGTFASTGLLSDAMAFPESFAFFELAVGPLHALPEKTARLEVLLDLANVVPAAEAISGEDLHLGCTPAVNVFDATMERTLGPGERAVVLQAGEDPLAEIVEVNRVTCGDVRFSAPEIPLYERSTPGDVLLGGVHTRLRRSPSVVGDRVDVELSFFSVDRDSEPAPGPQLHCELLATQRHACLDLAPGDVRGVGVRNVSRVVRGLPVRWGNETAWRHNAYARMPCAELGGRAAALESFLSLHDPHAREMEGAPTRVVAASRDRGQRLLAGTVQNGLHFTIEIDPHAFPGPGSVWLMGELVARALAERDDRLRYTRVWWGARDGMHDFGPRQGQLLPALLG